MRPAHRAAVPASVVPSFDLGAQLRAAANHAAQLAAMEAEARAFQIAKIEAIRQVKAARRRAALGTAAETVVDAICAVLPPNPDAAMDLLALRAAVNARLEREAPLTGINSAASDLARSGRIARTGRRGHYRYFNPHQELAP